MISLFNLGVLFESISESKNAAQNYIECFRLPVNWPEYSLSRLNAGKRAKRLNNGSQK